MWRFVGLIASVLVLLVPLIVAQSSPRVTFTPFEGVIQYLFTNGPFPPGGSSFAPIQRPVSLLILDRSGSVHYSPDQGHNWQRNRATKIRDMIQHEHDSSRIFLIRESDTTYYDSRDGGATFEEKKFLLPPCYRVDRFNGKILDFHPKHPEWILFVGEDCTLTTDGSCQSVAQIWKETQTKWETMLYSASKCNFAQDDAFTKVPDAGIYCVAPESPLSRDLYLYYSEDHFKTKTSLVDKVLGYYINQRYMLTATLVPRPDDATRQMLALHVSTNGKTFERIKLPPDQSMSPTSLTILNTNTFNCFIDLTEHPSSGVGAAFSSDQNGTDYKLILKDTHRLGTHVDFFALPGTRGIYIANQVQNQALKTSITLDNGQTWRPLPAPEKDSQGKAYVCADKTCHLHLFGTTLSSADEAYDGALFGRKLAPGLLGGVGHVATSLDPAAYLSMRTFLSFDAGQSFKEIMDRPMIFDFLGFGSLLVLTDERLPTTQLKYSFDRGQTFQQVTISTTPVTVKWIDSEVSGGQYKLILLVHLDGNSALIALDFEMFFTRACSLSDYETWPLKSNNIPVCMMGVSASYSRVKASSFCKVTGGALPAPVEVTCACGEQDFECQSGYYFNGNQCWSYNEALFPMPQRPEPCQGHYTVKSLFRRIDASRCSKGVDLTLSEERRCESAVRVKSINSISNVKSVYRFDATNSLVVMLQNDNGKEEVRFSNNEASNFQSLYQGNEKVTLIENEKRIILFNSETSFFLDSTGQMTRFILPSLLSRRDAIQFAFDSKDANSFVILGKECTNAGVCHPSAYVTRSQGQNWMPLGAYWSCAFFKQMIYCLNDNGVAQLTENQSKMLLPGQAIGLAVLDERYLVVSLKTSTTDLDLYVSLDGNFFAKCVYDTRIPPHEMGFTLLSSRGQLIVDILVDNSTPLTGLLHASNSNGTYLEVILRQTRRNALGQVDVLQFASLGEMLANTYQNGQWLTQLSFDEGRHWQKLTLFKECETSECELQLDLLMGDVPVTWDDAAPGVWVGVGRSGQSDVSVHSVYYTRDAGVSWKKLANGSFQSALLNRGNTIVLMNDLGFGWVSVDAGETMERFSLSTRSLSECLLIQGSTSLVMSVFCREGAFQLDTSLPRSCSNTDFEEWHIQRVGLESDCFLGEMPIYAKRLSDRLCDALSTENVIRTQTCTCSDADYECDYNYRWIQNQCQLIPNSGLPPQCLDENLVLRSTGYRRLPLTHCVGGLKKESDYKSPCLGKFNCYLLFNSIGTIESEVGEKLPPNVSSPLNGWWIVLILILIGSTLFLAHRLGYLLPLWMSFVALLQKMGNQIQQWRYGERYMALAQDEVLLDDY